MPVEPRRKTPKPPSRHPATTPISPGRDDDPNFRGRKVSVSDPNDADSLRRALSPVAEPLDKIQGIFDRRHDIEAEISNDLDRALQRRADKGERLRKLQAENAALKQNNEAAEAETNTLRLQSQDLDRQLRELSDSHQKALADQANDQYMLHAKLAQAESETHAARQQATEEARAAAEYKGKHDQVKQANEAVNKELKGLRVSADEAKRGLEMIKQKSLDDKKKHDERAWNLEAEMKRVAAESQRAREEERTKLEGQIKALSAENEKLGTGCARTRDLENQVKTLSAENGRLAAGSARTRDLENQVKQLMVAAESRRVSEENLRIELDDAREENEELEAKIARLEASNEAKDGEVQGWMGRYKSLTGGLGNPGKQLSQLAEELRAGEVRMGKLREKIAQLMEMD